MRTSAAAAVSEGEGPGSRHRLFGLTVAGDFPFSVKLPPDGGPAGLTLAISGGPLLPEDPVFPPLYASPLHDALGQSLGCLYREDGAETFRFPDAGDFRIGADRIDVHALAEGLGMAELRLLGPVLSYWLERQGIPALHASAVATDKGAVAFLSVKEGGKTGLAAAFLQAGFPLLTDDVLPVEEAGGTFLARPGYPQMRMWPDEARTSSCRDGRSCPPSTPRSRSGGCRWETAGSGRSTASPFPWPVFIYPSVWPRGPSRSRTSRPGTP